MVEEIYTYRWKNNEKRAAMYGRECRVIERMNRNSCVVQFQDNGQVEVISRNALKRVCASKQNGKY